MSHNIVATSHNKFRGLLNYLIMNAILSIGSINYVRMIESCRIIHGLFYISLS